MHTDVDTYRLMELISEKNDEIKELSAQLKEWKWFGHQINRYVLPGFSDTEDAALIAFKNLEAEKERLKEVNDLLRERIEQLERRIRS